MGPGALRRTLLMVALLAVPAAGSGAAPAEMVLHTLIPLGNVSFTLDGHRNPLHFWATAQSASFEGWRIVGDGRARALLSPNGEAVRYYPRALDFRVTASASGNPALELEHPLPLQVSSPLDDYLRNLQFRLKIFRGLHARVVQPTAVKMIGMPADVPYDERIFRVSFELPMVPIQDRMVLEVLAPDGERICKFHLDLL
jgi:hypothetical protein